MRVAVVGATGSIGRPVADLLAGRGHEVRRLSRSAHDFPVDLTTGSGLERALEGCDAVVEAANAGPSAGPARAVLIEGGRRLLDAAATAGVGHFVSISIVGCERVPLPYYRVKVEQEELVRRAPVPTSIVRATQFHPLIAGLFEGAARFRLLPGGRPRVQPVDPDEVAELIADVAEGEPRPGPATIAGPEVHDLSELAGIWREGTGRPGVVVPVPLPPALGRALRDGALTDPSPERRGTVRFQDWLGR